MKKKQVLMYVTFFSLMSLVGCHHNTIKKPNTLAELQTFLQTESQPLEEKETEGAKRTMKEISKQMFSTRTILVEENLSSYDQSYAIIKGKSDTTHADYDFESEIFQPIHDTYTKFVGLYENHFYEIVDFDDGKEKDTAKKLTIGTGTNEVAEGDIAFFTTMQATVSTLDYMESYFTPNLSSDFTLKPIQKKDTFSYELSTFIDTSDGSDQIREEVNLQISFAKDGFLLSYAFQYKEYIKEETKGNLSCAHLMMELEENVEIYRGERKESPATYELLPTNYWLTDYQIQLQARLIEDAFSCDANQLPLDYYIDAVVASTTPEKALDTKLTITKSTNQNVIQVNEYGVVKSVGIGDTVLTVVSESGIVKEIAATVIAESIQEIRVNIYSSTFYVGEEYMIFVSITPDNAVGELEASVSQPYAEIIYDEDGDPRLRCLAKGEVTITFTSKENPTISGSKTIIITEKLTLDEVKSNMIGTWTDVDIEQQSITFNDDFTGSFIFWDHTENQTVTYSFTWNYHEEQTDATQLVVTLSTMSIWDDNTAYFTMDGNGLRIAFLSAEYYYLAVSGNFIKSSGETL